MTTSSEPATASAPADGPAPLPRPVPDISVETKPFWDATLEERLLIGGCNTCDGYYWYPRQFCPLCGSLDTRWHEASGEGTVYSYTVVRRDVGDYAKSTPFVLAYVELAEGPRLISNLVDCDPEQVRIGDPVRAVFAKTEGEAALVWFAPVAS